MRYTPLLELIKLQIKKTACNSFACNCTRCYLKTRIFSRDLLARPIQDKMSLRCVSKCMVGRPKFKVYTLVIVGVLVGFSLSSILQTLDLGYVHSSKENKLKKIVDYSHVQSSKKAEFSNLEEFEPQIDLGDYQYDRFEQEQPKLEQNAQSMFDNAQEIERVESLPSAPEIPKDVKLKQFEYRSENWQGRNVRETMSNGLPPNKLADELHSRQTYVIAVITTVTQLMSQTLAIHGTWGPDALQVMYFVGEVNPMPHLPHGMNVIQLEGIDDKARNWELKEFTVVKYLIDNYLDRVDWFVVVGDETYIVTDNLEKRLNRLDSSVSVYLGRPGEMSDNGKSLLCRRDPGVVYSRGLLERLKPYLPLCWPGQGDMSSISGCISVMGLKCTQAKEAQELFVSVAKILLESTQLFSKKQLSPALIIHPVKYPKYMYRLHSFFKELEYNASMSNAKALIGTLKSTHPFIPSHMRSTFTPSDCTTTPPQRHTPTLPPPNPAPSADHAVSIRPRHIPKTKFEINYWEYFNQTRLMSIMNESPARGIIGGVREEARYALTKAIYLANQGVPQNKRYVFDKLENGYHRIDPMRGSEFILDFVFHRVSDKSRRIKKRLSILRPFHDTVVPIDAPELLPTVNFVVTLSGLSNRLEHFLKEYEQNVLQVGEDATLTVVLFDSPDSAKIRLMIQQYITRYQGARMTVVDAPGKFARGVGLDIGVKQFQDNQLLFLVDVDLDISTEFLQRCRLNTVQNKQVFFPVFFKLYNPDFVDKYHRGNSSLLITRHRGHWAHYSYGMGCLYASDYHKSGGFDTSMKGWGEEDVDLLNKMLKSGLEVFRAPDPGLVHNWHRKVCDRDSVTNPVAYEHCLQSKGENLADRVELSQYVFENELLNGNIL